MVLDIASLRWIGEPFIPLEGCRYHSAALISARDHQECRETQGPDGTGPPSVALADGRKEGLVFSFEKEVLGTH